MKSTYQDEHANLPIKVNISLFYAASFLIAILMAVVSVAGLLFRTLMYPTDELVRTFVSNDVVNLFIGLPILVGSMMLAWRGKLTGLLCWTGALFYVLYIYLLLQPILTDAPFAALDIVVIFAMGLVCFIPFALFVRGVMTKRNTSSKA